MVLIVAMLAVTSEYCIKSSARLGTTQLYPQLDGHWTRIRLSPSSDCAEEVGMQVFATGPVDDCGTWQRARRMSAKRMALWPTAIPSWVLRQAAQYVPSTSNRCSLRRPGRIGHAADHRSRIRRSRPPQCHALPPGLAAAWPIFL